MQEDFLYFIWKFQYFRTLNLITDQNETLEIIHPGIQNHNAGPDFLNAHLKINGIDWFGQVEMHINTSDWNRHKHSSNPSYQNVILHVVWSNDCKILRNDTSIISSLSLDQNTHHKVLENFTLLNKNRSSINCHQHINTVSRIYKLSMLDRVFIERLERKANVILKALEKSKRDWEECAYHTLASYFGFKVNNESFKRLAQIVPLRLLKLHSYQPLQIEALLFGSAGFLDLDATSNYETTLHAEYRFLSRKYSIDNKKMNLHEWNFLRLRPANFPTLRIAQLASIIGNIPHLCSAFLHISSKESFYRFMSHSTSEYWHEHYHFKKKAKNKISPTIGKSALHSLLINVIAPLQFAYGIDKGDEKYKEKAIDLLESLPPENNKITKQWKQLSMKNNSSLDSQGLIELYSMYCEKEQCLNCTIGTQILGVKNKR